MTSPLKKLKHHVTGAIERGEATPILEQPTPSLDADGRLVDWPPQSKPFGSRDYEAPRPAWLLLQNALASLPYSGGLGRALSPGQTPDEAFEALTRYMERLAEKLRHQVKTAQANDAELARYRGVLLAELDREDLLTELRAARAAIDRAVNNG